MSLKKNIDPSQLITSTMIVVFCDLKGSTKVLRELGPREFQDLQSRFFGASNSIVSASNFNQLNRSKPEAARLSFEELLRKEARLKPHANLEKGGVMDSFEGEFPAPWVRVDKFMGDCTMLYIKCGDINISELKSDDKRDVQYAGPKNPSILHQAARTSMQIVSSLIDEIMRIEKSMKLDSHAIKLGARVGLALGEGVCLSWLGEPGKPGYSYTVTGETVNLAARLEHASKAEFLSCINEEKSSIYAYTQHLTDQSHLHGTALGQALVEADRHLIDLYTVCDRRFQVRANEDFVHFLENGSQPVKLRWRRIPFSPQGFDGKQIACLLGGDSASDLFRTV
jgi:class 3 adenylate cyclase